MFPLRGLDRQPEVALDRQSQTDAQALEVFGAERRIAGSAPGPHASLRAGAPSRRRRSPRPTCTCRAKTEQPGIEKGVVRMEARVVIRYMEAEVPLDVLERQFHGVYHTA
ncbi:hypothetical protein WI88_15255 [Burkholderia ubonensis]|nr:hypothetical protein WI88_15255 [Burkholderia ubonensis]